MDVLKIYTKCYNIRKNRLEKSQQLINDYKVTNFFEAIKQAHKILEVEKINNKLNTDIMEYINENGDDFNLNSLFGNIKGVFVHEIDLYCGITSLCEAIFINSKHLFTHNYAFNEEDYSNFDEEYSESVLNDLKIYLYFNNDSANKFTTEELNNILYHWLQLGLFKYSNNFDEAQGLTVFGK
ncbi:hypothetical protein ABK040_000199 [Willaertia magna]